MARSNGTHAEKRTVMLRLRVTMSEKAELLKRAKEVGMTISDWVRQEAIGKEPVRRKVDLKKEIFLRLLAALGKCGSNLNQLARQANRKQENSEYEIPIREVMSLIDEFKGISNQLRKELDGDCQRSD